MQKIQVSVGSLESIPSVYNAVSSSLDKFNRLWLDGQKAELTWDLSALRIGHINISALSFFLAISHRIKQYQYEPQKIVIEWHPKIFSFLFDINFFEIADKYNLFEWPFAIGGHEESIINPHTKILSYDKLSEKPNINMENDLHQWKKIHREHCRQDIINRCESLFGDKYIEKSDLPLIMSRTCAELAINSVLWGDSTAFIGLQRTRGMVSISVSDIGLGFRRSLQLKNIKLEKSYKDIESIAIGSALNENDFGLKRAITTVLALGGDITISSNKGEVRWSDDNWFSYISNIENHGLDIALLKLMEYQYQGGRGYIKERETSIKGSRIHFYIPIETRG